MTENHRGSGFPSRRITSVEVTVASRTGATHEARGDGSDDAIGASPTESLPVTVAVADGHGDPRCVRARAGARFAVASALAVPPTTPDGAPTANAVLAGWRARVDADLRDHPLEPAEIAATDSAPAIAAAWTRNPRIAYGTTVLVCRVTSTAITVVQVGDGDVIAVDRDGVAARVSERDDPAALSGTPSDTPSGRTDSISAPDAERLLRTVTIPAADAPLLLILATDGFDNAYPRSESMLRAAAELAELRRDLGHRLNEPILVQWAADAARTSGDDASVAAVYLTGEPA